MHTCDHTWLTHTWCTHVITCVWHTCDVHMRSHMFDTHIIHTHDSCMWSTPTWFTCTWFGVPLITCVSHTWSCTWHTCDLIKMDHMCVTCMIMCVCKHVMHTCDHHMSTCVISRCDEVIGYKLSFLGSWEAQNDRKWKHYNHIYIHYMISSDTKVTCVPWGIDYTLNRNTLTGLMLISTCDRVWIMWLQM